MAPRQSIHQSIPCLINNKLTHLPVEVVSCAIAVTVVGVKGHHTMAVEAAAAAAAAEGAAAAVTREAAWVTTALGGRRRPPLVNEHSGGMHFL